MNQYDNKDNGVAIFSGVFATLLTMLMNLFTAIFAFIAGLFSVGSAGCGCGVILIIVIVVAMACVLPFMAAAGV